MKYYSLKSLLFFFEHEYNNDFTTIKKIVETFNDDLSDDETRRILFETLHEADMFEEGHFKNQTEVVPSQIEEIKWEPGSRETMAVFEQFEVAVGPKIIQFIFNLN